MKVDKLVKVYLKIRDKRKELQIEYDKKDEYLKDTLKEVETALLDVCKETGADSLRTEFGTVSRRVSKRYWTTDWNSMYEFVKDNDQLDLLEKRIAQGNMSTYLEENPDKLPPGLNVDSKYAVTVRRKS
jgi:hypothetical protein|tara:strand:- start:5043 stop:5429 length:387 start_codon:yes stop_codon:yes gene_type:complete